MHATTKIVLVGQNAIFSVVMYISRRIQIFRIIVQNLTAEVVVQNLTAEVVVQCAWKP